MFRFSDTKICIDIINACITAFSETDLGDKILTILVFVYLSIIVNLSIIGSNLENRGCIGKISKLNYY